VAIPPVLGSVAVHCASLKLNRRTGTEAWQGWRLPLSIEESKTNGGEDRMAATLCRQRPANPRSSRDNSLTQNTPCSGRASQGHAKGTLIQGKQKQRRGNSSQIAMVVLRLMKSTHCNPMTEPTSRFGFV